MEKHSLDSPPYENFTACPVCASAFVPVVCCDHCGNIILGEYVEIKDGKRYCDECYTLLDIADQDN